MERQMPSLIAPLGECLRGDLQHRRDLLRAQNHFKRTDIRLHPNRAPLSTGGCRVTVRRHLLWMLLPSDQYPVEEREYFVSGADAEGVGVLKPSGWEGR
jgi:hypothetical protein